MAWCEGRERSLTQCSKYLAKILVGVCLLGMDEWNEVCFLSECYGRDAETEVFYE